MKETLPLGAKVAGLSDRNFSMPAVSLSPTCPHARLALTVRVSRDDKRLYRIQCLDCGNGSQNIPHYKLSGRDMELARPFDRGIGDIRDVEDARRAQLPFRPIGWQIVNCDTDDPPPGMRPYQIYSYSFVMDWFRSAEDRHEWRLLPVWDGDVEDAIFTK
jgi:hypothetical protein